MRAAAEAGAATVDRLPLEGLTERETEVLAFVGRGVTNDEIAAALFLSPATSRTSVSHLLSRLGARDRAALVVLAYETGLVRPCGWPRRGPAHCCGRPPLLRPPQRR